METVRRGDWETRRPGEEEMRVARRGVCVAVWSPTVGGKYYHYERENYRVGQRSASFPAPPENDGHDEDDAGTAMSSSKREESADGAVANIG